MDFSLTEEEETAVAEFRRFLDAEIRPVANEYRGKPIPKEVAQATLKRLLPFGMGNGLVSEELGGLGLSTTMVGLLFLELAQVSPDLSIVVLIQLEAGMILATAEERFRQEYLAPLLEGNRLGAIAISEPGAGSNIAEITCRAQTVEDGYVIRGEKQWISNGHYSDFLICVARVLSESGEDQGIGLFVVDREQGYQTSNIPKMALNGQSTAQVFFDDVRVPASAILAPGGQGLKRLLALLEGSRPLVSLMAVAISQVALEESIRYASDRSQHGKVIAAHQLIQARIAEMSVQLDAARLLSFLALDRIDRGLSSELESAKAKYFATEAAVTITRHALAIHGANGVTLEYNVEELYRIAPILAVTEGTPEMQKLIIGRRLLGVAAF